MPLFLVLLAAIAAPAAVGGLVLCAALGEVSLIDVQFFPDDEPSPLTVVSSPAPAIADDGSVDDGSDSLTATVPPGFTIEVVRPYGMC